MSFVLFLYTELTVKNPMINLKIFKDHNFSLANLIVFIFGTGVFGLPDRVILFARGIPAGGGVAHGGKYDAVGESQDCDYDRADTPV